MAFIHNNFISHFLLSFLVSDKLSWMICCTLQLCFRFFSQTFNILTPYFPYKNKFLARMRSTSSLRLRQEFLKKWITGLQSCNFLKKNTSILERKKAIKLSADVAMASTREGLSTTCWSRALISNGAMPCNRRSKKIVKRSCGIRRRRRKCGAQPVGPSSIAKRMVKKRREILKSLIPGGEFMNEVSLIKETLDYIISLRAQVDVMRCFASASEIVNP